MRELLRGDNGFKQDEQVGSKPDDSFVDLSVNVVKPEPVKLDNRKHFKIIHEDMVLDNRINLELIHHRPGRRNENGWVTEGEVDIYRHVTTGDIYLFNADKSEISKWTPYSIMGGHPGFANYSVRYGFDCNMRQVYLESLDSLPRCRKTQKLIKKYLNDNNLIDLIQRFFPDYYRKITVGVRL